MFPERFAPERLGLELEFAVQPEAGLEVRALPAPAAPVAIAPAPKMPEPPQPDTPESRELVCWALFRGYQIRFRRERLSACNFFAKTTERGIRIRVEHRVRLAASTPGDTPPVLLFPAHYPFLTTFLWVLSDSLDGRHLRRSPARRFLARSLLV